MILPYPLAEGQSMLSTLDFTWQLDDFAESSSVTSVFVVSSGLMLPHRLGAATTTAS